jgi:hypothetical protein
MKRVIPHVDRLVLNDYAPGETPAFAAGLQADAAMALVGGLPG